MEGVFRLIPHLFPVLDTVSPVHAALDRMIRQYFDSGEPEMPDLEPFRGLVWPFVRMGNITSYDLFSLDELILFRFYAANRRLYRRVFDIGANLGLHSILLSRCGYEVHAFEPNRQHYDLLLKNLAANGCERVHARPEAVSDRDGTAELVQPKGNTTASHIRGARDFHGDVEIAHVRTVTLQGLDVRPDLMKIDVEGHEESVIRSLNLEDWRRVDAWVEIHNDRARSGVFDYFRGSGIRLFAQKIGWREARRLEELPSGYREGHVFVSARSGVPWGND
ncbi:MAG: FkbM family methyltransferase [Planctomycetes bacterium]|nr:FkbM family methyltransferase [Planctomycetota bacterium]